MAFQHSEMNQVRWYVALRTAPQTGSGSTVLQQLLDQLHEEIPTLTASCYVHATTLLGWSNLMKFDLEKPCKSYLGDPKLWKLSYY